MARHLHSHEDPAVVASLIAVVEQADVPVGAHARQKAHQRPGPLRKLEAVEQLVGGAARVPPDRERSVPADHVAHVELGHLVVGKVERLQALALEDLDDFRGLVTAVHLDADEYVSVLGIGDAVVELGDVARPERGAELLEAARALGDGDREYRLAPIAHLGALGDEAQPVEIRVRARGDGDELLSAHPGFLHVSLGAGDRQCAGGLEDRARVLEHVLDRRADLVGVDEDHAVEELPAQAKRLFADLLHGDPVGEETHVIQHDAPSGLERARHGVGVHRFDAEDLDRRAQPLDVGSDAGNEPAAADRHEHRVDRVRGLTQDFHSDRALARDHVRIFVGVDEAEPACLSQALRLDVRFVVGIAVQVHFRSAGLDRVDLDLGGRGRHDDHRRAAELLGGKGHALSVIAGRRGDDSARERRSGQIRHLVVGAAALEGEHRLHVLALQKHPVAEPRREIGRDFQGRLHRHVVHARPENPLQIVVFHRVFSYPLNGGQGPPPF